VLTLSLTNFHCCIFFKQYEQKNNKNSSGYHGEFFLNPFQGNRLWCVLLVIIMACVVVPAATDPVPAPSSYPSVAALESDIFDILDLTSNGATSVDVSSHVGDFYGSVALSSERVFVVGSEGTVGFPKDDLSSASPVLVTGQNHTLVTNLATQEIYALGDESEGFLQGVGILECLVPLDPDTALRAPPQGENCVAY